MKINWDNMVAIIATVVVVVFAMITVKDCNNDENNYRLEMLKIKHNDTISVENDR